MKLVPILPGFVYLGMRMILFLSMTALFTFGCASISTTYTASPEGEFDRYQTFYCLECQDDLNLNAPKYDNEENRELIRQAIRIEMEKKGYIYTSEEPDLLAHFHVVIEDKSEVVEEAYPLSWQNEEFSPFPVNYQYGTLIVQLVDGNTDQLVWQGSASKVLENPKNARQTIQRGIIKIFKNYKYTGY